MRELKFRAWNKVSKRYHSTPVITQSGRVLDTRFDDEATFDYDIEQYTGLHDKNGKEIYEGDIVTWTGKICFVIYWKGGYYCYGDDLPFDSILEPCEVIGNIHENPELLEEK